MRLNGKKETPKWSTFRRPVREKRQLRRRRFETVLSFRPTEWIVPRGRRVAHYAELKQLQELPLRDMRRERPIPRRVWRYIGRQLAPVASLSATRRPRVRREPLCRTNTGGHRTSHVEVASHKKAPPFFLAWRTGVARGGAQKSQKCFYPAACACAYFAYFS